MHDVQKFELAFKAIASVIALAGAIIAIAKYLDEKAKENRTARIEAQKPFYTKQQEVYYDLIETTAFLSNWPESSEWEDRRKHFWVLFWGPVPLVADEGVSIAVDKFSQILFDDGDGVSLRNASMDLARACRRSLGFSWRFQTPDFSRRS